MASRASPALSGCQLDALNLNQAATTRVLPGFAS